MNTIAIAINDALTPDRQRLSRLNNMLTNNYLLKLSDRIICSSDSKAVLMDLVKNLEKDLGDIEEQFETGKKLLINSGKYPINDPEVDAPVYSRALSEQFKLLKNKIWSNPKYQYLLDYNLKDIIYHKGASWCNFKIEKILHVED